MEIGGHAIWVQILAPSLSKYKPWAREPCETLGSCVHAQ